ncbi:kinase-like protein [Schizopora paradoxa]|uniref:Kinase-like protein n=1 Tax=Schizopora paradoxa TaxID=27342 RepID=A0A0H2S317_9AGAM|nr:kinase-like protein [Schizopora paradoxa]
MSKYRYRPSEAKRVIWSILNGVSFMHSHNIIHNDLKLENVMYLKANPEYLGPEVHSEVVIIDFGLAQVLTDGVAPDLHMGTPEYMPPEKLKRRYKYTDTKADMWALGVLSFIIYCGFFPYPFPTDTNHSKIYETIMREHIDWPERHELMITENDEHRQAKSFIKTLLQKDPSARADSGQALLHSWFDDLLNVASLRIDDSTQIGENEEFRSTWPVIDHQDPCQNLNHDTKGNVRKKLKRRHTVPVYRKSRRSPRTEFLGNT